MSTSQNLSSDVFSLHWKSPASETINSHTLKLAFEDAQNRLRFFFLTKSCKFWNQKTGTSNKTTFCWFLWNFHCKYGRCPNQHSTLKNRMKGKINTLLSIFENIGSLQSYEQITGWKVPYKLQFEIFDGNMVDAPIDIVTKRSAFSER